MTAMSISQDTPTTDSDRAEVEEEEEEGSSKSTGLLCSVSYMHMVQNYLQGYYSYAKLKS